MECGRSWPIAVTAIRSAKQVPAAILDTKALLPRESLFVIMVVSSGSIRHCPQ
jgi:hypothetical protein